jgi:uncharacterized protein YecT (DUF1311 family)
MPRSTPPLRACARLSFALLAWLLGACAHAADGPSFDCAHVTSHVNKLICASPELSALDLRLAEHYRALRAQPGVDAAALQRDELSWLREVRDPCPDAACVAQAYAVWDSVLLARSRRAASPAATAETQPFRVDAALLADARALRGKVCAAGEDVPRSEGFLPVPGVLPVIFRDSVVLVRRHLDADFAFLLDTRHDACRMVDVVALPPHAQAGKLLQCVVPANDATAAPLSSGVGLRGPGQGAPLAYWEVDVEHGEFIRQALGVLGWAPKLQCRAPELADGLGARP